MRFPLWLCIALFSLLVIAACASQRAPGTDWLARRVAAVPQPIDVTDARWSEAPPAYLPLHEGSHGRLSGDVVELRALYDEIRIAFRARWRGEVLPAASLQFALLWRKDGLPEQRGECHTACHRALGDGQGGVSAVVAAVVPAGREEPIASWAQWQDGIWSLTWVRSLRSDDIQDIQFADLTRVYPVRAKVWRGLADAPDWITERYALKFAPASGVSLR